MVDRVQMVPVRLDESVAKQADAVLRKLGFRLSDAVRVLLTRVARDKALPFELFTPNAATVAAIEDSRARRVERVSIEDLKKVIDASH